MTSLLYITMDKSDGLIAEVMDDKKATHQQQQEVMDDKKATHQQEKEQRKQETKASAEVGKAARKFACKTVTKG
jgi:hypothetical protein